MCLSGGCGAQLTVTLTSEAGQLGVTLSSPISRAWLQPQWEVQGGGDHGPLLAAVSTEARLHLRLPAPGRYASSTYIPSATPFLRPFLAGPLETNIHCSFELEIFYQDLLKLQSKGLLIFPFTPYSSVINK